MSYNTITPYLMYNGRCQEALDFYRQALGAEIGMVMRFDESPEPPPPGQLPPGYEKKIMHAEFRIGGTTVMCSDGCDTAQSKFDGISLALAVKNEAEAQRAFAALSDGGQVTMPLGKTFWSPCFGMVSDRFGLGWMVSVPGEM
jgi:PhnB protein